MHHFFVIVSFPTQQNMFDKISDITTGLSKKSPALLMKKLYLRAAQFALVTSVLALQLRKNVFTESH